MAAGYELTEPEPTAANIMDVMHCPQVNVRLELQYTSRWPIYIAHVYVPQVAELLGFIFRNPKKRIPTVEELLISDFFRNIDLREMRAISLPVIFSSLSHYSNDNSYFSHEYLLRFAGTPS